MEGNQDLGWHVYSSRSCQGIIPPRQTSIRPQGSRETKSSIGAIRVGTTARTQAFTSIGTWYNVLCGNCQYYLQVSCRDQRVGIKLTVPCSVIYTYFFTDHPISTHRMKRNKRKEDWLFRLRASVHESSRTCYLTTWLSMAWCICKFLVHAEASRATGH